jgi:hypothetical protein
MALANAKDELRKMSSEFERLAKRKAQLEAFIANAQPLIGEPAQLRLPAGPSTAAETKAADLKEYPLWKAITLSINGKGHAFTVRDAVEALDRIGRPVTSANRVQIVRNVLMKKKDTFIHKGPGVFALIQAKEKEAPEETP